MNMKQKEEKGFIKFDIKWKKDLNLYSYLLYFLKFK